ncbi:MAG: TolC family protein, partial [Ignavibacteria bacterium]
MPKNFKHILITGLIVCLNSINSFSQNKIYVEHEKDTIYRYNIFLSTLDSLINNAFKGRAFHDTIFYNSFVKAEAMDLNQLIYFSLSNNPELKAMRYNIDAEITRSKEFSSLPDPMLEAEADFIASNFKKVGEINFYGSQSFPFPGKLSLKKKSAENSASILEAEHHNMEIRMINMVKMNFYDLFLNMKKLEINNDSRLLIKIFTTAAESKYAVGKGMQQEVFKSQIEQSKLLNQELILRQERKNILSNLTKLT